MRPRYGYRCLGGLTAAFALFAAWPASAHGAGASGTAGTIYYTVYSPAAVKKVQYRSTAQGLLLGDPIQIAAVPHADGIVTAPDGSFLIGGGAGVIYRLDPATGTVTSVATGAAAYHIALDPSNKKVWTAGLPAPLSEVPISPLGPGTARPLHGDDTSITSLAFDPAGRAFYTASNPGGSGNFGTIDMTTLTTHRYLAQVRGVHGLVYDSFSRDLILVGGYEILQVAPDHPGDVLSSRIVTGALFDQGIVDGKGHLFVASNLGQLVYLDYSVSGLIGDTKNIVSQRFLEAKLDDLAPFPPAAVVVKPSRTSRKAAAFPVTLLLAGLGLVVAIGAAGGGFVGFRRWRRVGREFP